MIKLKELLTERKSDYITYHSSFTDAADEAKRLAERMGYEIDEDDWFNEVAVKYPRGRPSVGKTNKFSVALLKNGKPQRKRLQFQVYGMEGGRFELNAYIQ